MLTLTMLLVLTAFVSLMLSFMGKSPLSVLVLCLVILEVLRVIPR